MKKIQVGDFLYNYFGDCSHRRDKTKDKNSVHKFQVVDIVSDPSNKKPTLLIREVPKEDRDKTKNRCWFSEILREYNITETTE